MQDDVMQWIWLGLISNRIGAARVKKLLDIYKSPKDIWSLDEYKLGKISFISDKLAKHFCDKKLREDAGLYQEKVIESCMNIIGINDEDYPDCLKNIYDPPVIIYVKGNLKREDKCIAVVGARSASQYGLDTAQRISFELSKFGITVVSGMARGIDSRAHCGALKGGGRTIAVMGCGLDIAYPPENSQLMKGTSMSGALISEYPPGSPPLPANFPARNRIISGLSMGVIVVEANERSGSLITANFALEQGREVFAVPGNVDSINSRGTNKLIKDGAKIVTGIGDILEELQFASEIDYLSMLASLGNYDDFTPAKIDYSALGDDERKVLSQLGKETVNIDSLAFKCGFSIQYLNSMLFMMEMKGILKQLPGKNFRLKE